MTLPNFYEYEYNKIILFSAVSDKAAREIIVMLNAVNQLYSEPEKIPNVA